MATIRKRREKTVEAHQKRNVSPGCIGVKKSKDKSSGQHQREAENPGVLPSTDAQRLTQQLASQSSFPQNTEVHTMNITSDKFRPSKKIKLQLFPIDAVTRRGLEKDGYNPFLELTLKAQKKVSSVLKHIDTKWGSSSTALGEPMLVPFDIQLEMLDSVKRWTLNDTCIRVGDVYAAIDSPIIFRLRYGWFSNLEPKMPFESSPFEACLESEGISKACITTSELTPDSRKEVEVTSEEFEKPGDAGVTEQMSMDPPVNYLDDEVKMDNGLEQAIVPWDDSLTNLSIGGLFSEASLLGKGKINNLEAASNGSKSALQTPGNKGIAQPPFSWDDSLTNLSIGGLLSEASLQGKIHSHTQPAKPSLHDSHSSILDAEETCHAFAFRKFSSSSKDDVTLNGSANSGSSSHEKQAGLAEPPYQESKTDHLPGSRIHNEDNSLGLTGIKWNDSLGPFDLGISNFQQVLGGDSISSFSRIFR